jgi:hypothetical protein
VPAWAVPWATLLSPPHKRVEYKPLDRRPAWRSASKLATIFAGAGQRCASYTGHRGNLMTEHVGSCLCGRVKFEVQGDFEGFYLCHCKHCQKDTGSAHAANLFSQSSQLVWRSGAEAVTTFMLPGTSHNKSFCKWCGSAVPSTQIPGLLVVPAGCLDTEISMAPTAHIFSSSKADWDKGLGDVPEFEGLPE